MANRWKGLVCGALGGMLATYVMGRYNAATAPAVSKLNEVLAPCRLPPALDSISLVGQQHEEGETARAAAGRIVYRRLSGAEPQTDETRQLLGEMTYWTYGCLLGAIYGACHAPWRSAIGSGLGYGAAAWLIGSETAVPLLGLSEGPGRTPCGTHVNRAAGHLVYGLTMALTTSALEHSL